MDPSEFDNFLVNLPQVEDHALEMLDSDISDQEIMSAISNLKNDTCPGLDGLISELFKKFKVQFTTILQWLWGESLNCSELPQSIRSGVIALIFKKGDPENLKNWRPITMSNTDFKVFAIVIKNRFSKISGGLIGPYQTCNVKGSCIYDNLSFLRDNLNPNTTNGAVMSIDQENAFGNVDRTIPICLKF